MEQNLPSISLTEEYSSVWSITAQCHDRATGRLALHRGVKERSSPGTRRLKRKCTGAECHKIDTGHRLAPTVFAGDESRNRRDRP